MPLLRRASAGAILRGSIALILSYVDLGSRFALLGSFLATGQTNFAFFQLGIFAFNHGCQSLFVALTNQPISEHILVWTSTKLPADIYRAATNQPTPERVHHSAGSICLFTRLIDLGSESMLSIIFLSYVLAISPEWSLFSVITLCTSLASSAYTAADAHVMKDAERASRDNDHIQNCLL